MKSRFILIVKLTARCCFNRTKFINILNRFEITERAISWNSIEFTIKASDNIQNTPQIRDEELPLSALHAKIDIFLLGKKGLLSSEVFQRPGTKVASFRFALPECYRPLLVSVTKLEPASLYKVVVALEHNRRALTTQISFMSTVEKEVVPEPEEDIDKIGLCQSEVDVIDNLNNYKQEVIEARKAKNWKDYIACGQKYPEAYLGLNREKRVQRSIVIGSALDMWIDEADEIINGGWFMGPLYTHDPHYKKMMSKM